MHHAVRGVNVCGRVSTVLCEVPMRAAFFAPCCAWCQRLRPYEHRALRGANACGPFLHHAVRGANVCGRSSTVLCVVSMRAAIFAPRCAWCQFRRPFKHRALRGVHARGRSCTTLCEVSMSASVSAPCFARCMRRPAKTPLPRAQTDLALGNVTLMLTWEIQARHVAFCLGPRPSRSRGSPWPSARLAWPC